MESFNSSAPLSRIVFNQKELSDPVTYLLNSFYTPLIISSVYVLFVRKIGPMFMENRQPYNINRIISAYNLLQVVFNCYLCLKSFEYLYHHRNSFFCILPETPGSEMYDAVTFLTKLFFVNKTADLLDTIFFVLKKKDSHLTFLHLYHHMLTFVGSWFVGNYVPGGGLAIFGLINAFVHAVMYGYYFISSLSINKGILAALKKPVTQLQLVQFAIVGVYGINMMSTKSCPVPTVIRYLGYFGLSQVAMMIILFTNFYRKAYLEKSLAAKQQKIRSD